MYNNISEPGLPGPNSHVSRCSLSKYIETLWQVAGADLEGGAQVARAPSIFGRDRASDFVWAPQAKSMHQIVAVYIIFHKDVDNLRWNIEHANF